MFSINLSIVNKKNISESEVIFVAWLEYKRQFSIIDNASRFSWNYSILT